MKVKYFTTVFYGLIVVFSGIAINSAVNNTGAGAEVQKPGQGSMHYFKLVNLYRQWHEGLFGSRNYNKRLLESFLLTLIGREIETEKTFVLHSPDGYIKRYVECKFASCRWLYIFGEIDKKSLLDFAEKNPTIKDKVLRDTVMFGIKGVVRKYRITRDTYGDTVELYLYGVTLVQ